VSASRSWRLALCAAALCWPMLSGARAVAQWLEADPPGSYLALRGAVSLSGAAPLPIDALPPGEYGLRAEGPGLAAARGRFVRSLAGLEGRPWADATALGLPPGLLHLRRGEARGWSFLGAAAVSAGMAGRTQLSLRDAEKLRDRAALDYEQAVSEEQIRGARRRSLAAAQEVRDREEVRDLWLGILALSWAGAGLEALLLTPQPSLAPSADGGYVATLPRASRSKAAFRSLLVPGAGQRSMGREGRGSLFLTAIAGLGAGAVAAHDAFLEARREQSAAQRLFDEAEDEAALRAARASLERAAERTDDRNALRWALVGAAAGVYVWNVLDAFGLGTATGTGDLTWSLAPAAGGGFVCATWSVR